MLLQQDAAAAAPVDSLSVVVVLEHLDVVSFGREVTVHASAALLDASLVAPYVRAVYLAYIKHRCAIPPELVDAYARLQGIEDLDAFEDAADAFLVGERVPLRLSWHVEGKPPLCTRDDIAREVGLHP